MEWEEGVAETPSSTDDDRGPANRPPTLAALALALDEPRAPKAKPEIRRPDPPVRETRPAASARLALEVKGVDGLAGPGT